MIAFFVGLGLGALIVFLLSLGAHYSRLEYHRNLKREVAEFRNQELDRLIADGALRCTERPTASRVKC